MAITKYDLDINKQAIIKPVVILRQGDHDIDTMQVSLSVANEPMDLTGATVTFMGNTANGRQIIDDAHVKIIDAKGGVFEYVFPSEASSDIGEYKVAYFSIILANGQSSTMDFRVQVLSGVDISAPVASEYITHYDTMVTALNSAYDSATHETNEKMASTVSSLATSAATVLDSALARVNTVNSTANSASSAASKAVSMASSVAGTVTSQASYINSVASSAASSVSSVAAGVVDKLNNISVGGRNYILNSKRVLDTQDPSAAHNGNSWWDTDWLDTSIPISDFSNKVLTISIQADYDNVPAANSGARLGMEIVAHEVNPDGSIKERYINNWRNVEQGDSFHGRFSTTVDLRGVTLQSISTPTHWGGGLYIQGISGTNISLSNPKIEISNVGSDWSPAPEDVVQKSGDTMTGNLTAPQVIARDLLTGFHNVIQVPTTTIKIIDLINNEFIKGKGFWKEATYIAYNTVLSDAPTNDGYSIIKLATRGTNRTYVEYSDLSGNVWHTTATTNTLGPWVKQANDSEVVHKTGNETVAGDKTLTGNTTLANIKSSSIKTANVTMGLLTLHFQQTAVGVNVYVDGTWSGTFSMSDSYISSGISIPSVISKPQLPVILNIISNGGIGGVTTNSPLKLEVLIDTDGVIKYRAKTLRDNDTTARNSSIVGADSTFYAVG